MYAFVCLNWVADMKSKAQLGQLATTLIVQLWLGVLHEGSYRQGTQTKTKTWVNNS